MEIKELIKLNGREVRRDSNLMAIYIDAFKEVFGKIPNCAGCTFNSDFQKLKNAVSGSKKQTTTKSIIMSKTFKLYHVKGEILTFKKGKKTIRQYDNLMTEEFAIGFLTNGTPEQIEERKKLFRLLPKEVLKPKEETKDVKNIEVSEVKEEPKQAKPRAKRTKKAENE